MCTPLECKFQSQRLVGLTQLRTLSIWEPLGKWLSDDEWPCADSFIQTFKHHLCIIILEVEKNKLKKVTGIHWMLQILRKWQDFMIVLSLSSLLPHWVVLFQRQLILHLWVTKSLPRTINPSSMFPHSCVSWQLWITGAVKVPGELAGAVKAYQPEPACDCRRLH